jgi:uncharacterized protein
MRFRFGSSAIVMAVLASVVAMPPFADSVLAQIPMEPAKPISPAAAELFKMIELQRDKDIRAAMLKGVSPETVDGRGDHALLIVARDGYLDGAKILLDAGAKVNRRNKWGDSAIMVAALSGHENMVRLLRSKGADINNPGWTALHYAATNGHDSVVKYLLDQGADPLAAGANGVTALMMAARENRTGAINVLLEYGADPKQKNAKGETAYDWAVREEHASAIEILKKAK